MIDYIIILDRKSAWTIANIEKKRRIQNIYNTIWELLILVPTWTVIACNIRFFTLLTSLETYYYPSYTFKILSADVILYFA
jgi:hypothetical protein